MKAPIKIAFHMLAVLVGLILVIQALSGAQEVARARAELRDVPVDTVRLRLGYPAKIHPTSSDTTRLIFSCIDERGNRVYVPDTTRSPDYIFPHQRWEMEVSSRIARLEQQVDSLKKAIECKCVNPASVIDSAFSRIQRTEKSDLRGINRMSPNGNMYGFNTKWVSAIYGNGKETFVVFEGDRIYIGEPVETVAKNLGLKITPAEAVAIHE